MAKRPIFCCFDKKPYFIEKNTEFKFYPGFSVEQKQRSIQSLHEAYLQKNRAANILEISSKSPVAFGRELSAFSLKYKTKSGKWTTVESAFQSGKVFENGGHYTDLLFKPSIVSKKDKRIRSSGRIIEFCLEDDIFPTVPKTFFYDWIYINAIASNEELANKLLDYDSFTDIEFNPQKSINCQARSAAIFVSLCNLGILQEVIKSKDVFCQSIYDVPNRDTYQQLELF